MRPEPPGLSKESSTPAREPYDGTRHLAKQQSLAQLASERISDAGHIILSHLSVDRKED
jgi:hypothetical protein